MDFSPYSLNAAILGRFWPAMVKFSLMGLTGVFVALTLCRYYMIVVERVVKCFPRTASCGVESPKWDCSVCHQGGQGLCRLVGAWAAEGGSLVTCPFLLCLSAIPSSCLSKIIAALPSRGTWLRILKRSLGTCC